jgi:hypothetical protein
MVVRVVRPVGHVADDDCEEHAMRRRGYRAIGLALLCVSALGPAGCVTSQALLQALSNDLALTTSAAAQGLFSGLFSRFGLP